MAKILYVEDNQIINNAVTLALQSAGHEVDSTLNSSDAIDNKLPNNTYDLVLTDFDLGSGYANGIAVIHAARERNPKIPAVLATSAFLEDIKNLPSDKPFPELAYVSKTGKPGDVNRIQAVVRRTLEASMPSINPEAGEGRTPGQLAR